MYAGQGVSQCCSKIDPRATDGSAGWYEKDAKLFASWNIDYLKFGNMDFSDTRVSFCGLNSRFKVNDCCCFVVVVVVTLGT